MQVATCTIVAFSFHVSHCHDLTGVTLTKTEMNSFKKKMMEEFYQALKWINMRKQSLRMMRDTADKIDTHYKNVNISRIVGAGTAVAGGAMALGGSIATLATAGLAAPITAPVIAAGTAMSILGGGTSAGASIADVIISKLKISGVQKQIDADNEMLEELIKVKSEMKGNIKVIKMCSSRSNCSRESREVEENEEVLEAPKPEKKEGVKASLNVASTVGRVGTGAAAITQTGGTTAAKLGVLTVKAGKNAAQLAKVGGHIAKGGATAARVGRVALQAAAVGGIVVEVVVIPLNIAEIVVSGLSLYRGSETKAGRTLRENADKYEEQMKKVIKICDIPESAISD